MYYEKIFDKFDKLLINKSTIIDSNSQHNNIEITLYDFNNGKLTPPDLIEDYLIDYDFDLCPVCEFRTKLGNTDKSYTMMFFVPVKKVFRLPTFFERLIGKTEPIFTGNHEIDVCKFRHKFYESLNKFINQIK